MAGADCSGGTSIIHLREEDENSISLLQCILLGGGYVLGLL